MRLHAKIMKGSQIVMEDEAVLSGEGKFQQQLEHCFIELCRNMGISVPMWIGKNTREFARYRRTTFNADQFLEKVSFDRFEIRLFE